MAQVTIQARPEAGALPRAIRRVLGRLDRRLRWASVLRGMGTVALVVALGAAAGMAVDFGLVLPRMVRWAIWGAWLASSAVAIAGLVLRPMVRGGRALDLAGVAERIHPELGERLTGAVGLLAEARGSSHGSPDLIAALAADVSRRVATIDPARGVSLSRETRQLALGFAALGLVAAPGLVRPDPFGVLARRFLAPWADLDRIGRFALTVAPGDRVAALGSDLTVSARVRARFGSLPAPESAWLEWTGDDGNAHRVPMPAETDAPTAPVPTSSPDPKSRGFAVTLPRLSGSFSYRVVSGSSASRGFRITAIEPPSVVALRARVDPPSYTKRPAALASDPSRIEAWEGSRITLEVSASRPLRHLEVDWPKTAKAIPATLASDRKRGTARLVAESSGSFAVRLRDEYGLSSRPESPRRLVVLADAPPVVAVRGSESAEESRPDDTLEVGIAARDDVAVASVELHYAIERQGTGSESDRPETGHMAVALKGLGTRAARGLAELPLGPLGLKPGDALGYRVRVADNRPAPKGPNVVWSAERSLAIVARAEPLRARRDRADREGLQAKLDELKKAAAENRKEAEQLRYAADAAQRGNGPWDRTRQQALDQREAEARGVADRLQLLARDLADDPQFSALARPARQIAEVEAESGRAMLDRARRREDAAERLDDLRQADARLAAVTNRLDELQQRFNALARRDDDLRKLRDLAGREEAIADRAGTEAADRAGLDRLQADQAAVQADLDALLKKSPELRAEVLAAQADEAQALAKRARDLADRQRKEARRATDPSAHAQALKALAEAQRALEDDARRLALDVDTPLAENGRGRVNTEAVRQATEPIERADLEQARQRLEGAEAELRRLARDLEDVPDDPKALAQRLVRRQDALNQQTAEAIRETVANPNDPRPDEKAALAARLKPLAGRQEAIARLAEAIRPQGAPGSEAAKSFPKGAVEAAARSATRAAESLRETARPREIEARRDEARRSLQRLADALPDVWRRQEPSRRKLAEAMQQAEAVQRELEQHLRETAPHPGRPFDPAKAADTLADRVAPLARRQAKVAETLGAMEVEPRAEPQRSRASRRARALTEALETVAARDRPLPDRQAVRETLGAVQLEARAGLERLEQKVHGRVPADDLAEELADDQRVLRDRAAKPDSRAAEADAQKRIATALRTLPVPDAPIAQGEAVRAAERAANALADPDPKHDPAPAVRQAVAAAQALADRLADRQGPRARASALARAERALNEPEGQADPAASEDRQRAVLDDLARLPLPGQDKAAALEAARHAAELAARARGPRDNHPASGQPTPAALAEARARAAEALERLAAGPADPPAQPDPPPARAEAAPRDPELGIGAPHAEAAHQLARRERQVREQLQALLGERVEPQQALRRESAALGQELADLRDRARPLSDRGHGPAHEAAQLLGEHAPRAMDQGAEHLARAQAAGAREAQRRAAELVERGAQQAEDLAAALRADRPAEAPPPPDGQGAPHGPLAEAREAMAQAARQLDQARDPTQGGRAPQAAQQAMAGAARGLRAAADQAAEAQGEGEGQGTEPGLAGQSEPKPGNPNGQNLDPKGTQAGRAAPDLAALQAVLRSKTGRSWGELPGHLRTEILQMSQGRYRDDYARLIQLYFREIAAGAEPAR